MDRGQSQPLEYSTPIVTPRHFPERYIFIAVGLTLLFGIAFGLLFLLRQGTSAAAGSAYWKSPHPATRITHSNSADK